MTSAAAAFGQATDQQPPATTPPPPPLSGAAATTYERRDALPSVNIYVPEGQASIRIKKLIRNVLFESQIDYKFAEGDISTYLRYKYYARNFTYRLGVFDSIEFPDVGEDSRTEFERVRGGLLLIGIPRDHDNRYFFLLQNDRLTFGELENVDNRKNNIYTKIGYQFGTPFDERMNAIVGETRGRITPVLTAFRDIGPQRGGLAAAITQSIKAATGDYEYTKFEAEGLRRFDVTQTTFFVSRLHTGLFFGHEEIEERDDRPEAERFSIPRYELFRLGGREALRAIGEKAESLGTHEIHLTNEYFVPVFRNKNYRTGPLHWNNMYGILYAGAGAVGFGYDTIGDTDRFVADAGIGSEFSVTVRDFDVLFSIIYAHTIHAPADLEGGKFRFSIRTVR